MIVGHRGDSARVCVDIHADEACARLGTWLPSELRVDGVPSGGTGFGKLTRVTSGVNLPPLEVIMSRLLHLLLVLLCHPQYAKEQEVTCQRQRPISIGEAMRPARGWTMSV